MTEVFKKYLAKQAPATSLGHLQLQLDSYRPYYNQHRPHRSLGLRTPLVAFTARIKARPAERPAAAHFRVRLDRVDTNGTVTLRYQSKLRHIAIGRAHKYEPVRLLIADDLVRVIGEDGDLIRELTLDPSCDYQRLDRDASMMS